MNSGDQTSPIVIGAFGDAADPRPIIRGSKSLGVDRNNPCMDWVQDPTDPGYPNVWELVPDEAYCASCAPSCLCNCETDFRFCSGQVDDPDEVPADCGREQLVFNLDQQDERLGRKRRIGDSTLDREGEWRFNRYVTSTPQGTSYYFTVSLYSEADPDLAFTNIEIPRYDSALALGNIYTPEPISTQYVTVQDLEFQLATHTLEMKLAKYVTLERVKVKYGYDCIRMGPQTEHCVVRDSEVSNAFHVGVNCLGAPDLGDISPVRCSFNLFEHNHFFNDRDACNYAEYSSSPEYDADCGMVFAIYGREPVLSGHPIIYGSEDNVVRYNFFENNQGNADNSDHYLEGRGGGGIRIVGLRTRFYYNIVANGRDSGVDLSSSGGMQDGAFVGFASRDNWIFDNTIYGNWGPGIVQVEHPCKDEYNPSCTDNWTSGNLIYNNILHNNDEKQLSWSILYPVGFEPNPPTCPDYDALPPNPSYTFHAQVLVNGINTAGAQYVASQYKNNLLLYGSGSNGSMQLAHFRTRQDILNNGCLTFLTVPAFNTLSDNGANFESDPLYVASPPEIDSDFDLSKGSPAINKGRNTWSLLQGEDSSRQAKDYRSDPVTPKATPDVGAYEGTLCGTAGGAGGWATAVVAIPMWLKLIRRRRMAH